jgi:hypothetical protein
VFYTTGRHTESVGTNIVAVCPAQGIRVPVLRAFSATASATAQSLYVMTPVGIFETDDFTDAGETTTRVTTTKPGRNDAGALVTLSSGDLVVAINRDEQYELLEVSSVSGDTVTWATAPTSALLHRCLLYAFYTPIEPFPPPFPPQEPVSQPYVDIPANTTVTHTNAMFPAARTKQQAGVPFTAAGCPMLVLLTNDTNQAVLNWCSFSWIDSTDTLVPDTQEIFDEQVAPIIIPKEIPK